MPQNPKKYLYDISTSINTILENYLSGIDSFEQYIKNPMIQDAVERRLMIIAEATSKLRKAGIILPFSDSVINRRNTMAHQYDEYSDETIWQSLHRELPALKEEADRLLAE